MASICGKKKKRGVWLLAAVILLTGCAMPAPTDMGTKSSTSEQILEETEAEQAVVTPEYDEDLAEMEEWLSQSPYAWAYYEFLQECIQNGGTPISISRGIPTGIWDIRFELVFIDEDDIPELLIFLDDCHAAGVEVFTYTDDSVVGLGEFGSFGKMQYVEKGGMIFDHYMGQGEAHTYFFQMEDGEAKQISHMHSWPDNSRYLETGEYREFYEIDEFSVTEDVYQAKWEELYDSQEYVLIGYEDGIPLNETELLPRLTQAIENLL
ncbi:MAG: hypothetical protein K2H45_06650 [Acetatifactor sp.]|nr:hypothetical protein [Acetatifactor sp.]